MLAKITMEKKLVAKGWNDGREEKWMGGAMEDG